MYKLLLVDDEMLIRKSLTESIDWNALGVSVSTADNGQIAFDKIHEDPPDILITDIRMPLMDGLDLIQAIQLENFRAKSVIISGYSNFAYAQRALSLGAIGYILKPIANRDVIDMVQKAIGMIDAEKDRSNHLMRLEQQLHENIPVMKNLLVQSMLTGNHYDNAAFAKRLRLLNLELPVEKWTALIVIRYRSFDTAFTQDKLTEIRKLTFHEWLQEIPDSILFLYDEEQTFLFHFSPLENTEASYEKCRSSSLILRQIIEQKAREDYGVDVVVGLSEPFADISRFRTAYKQAIQPPAPEECCKNGTENKSAASFILKKRCLIDLIESCSEEKIHSGIIELFATLPEHVTANPDAVKAFAVELLMAIKQSVVEKFASGDLFDSLSDFYNDIYLYSSQEEIIERLNTEISEITAGLSKRESGRLTKLMQQAKDYIDNNYVLDLSLDRMGQYIGFTPGYFSELFKQYTGENFSVYLTRCRIDNAKKLLRENTRVYEAAEQSGFHDSKYFNRIFKKLCGVTPSQYREQFLSGNLYHEKEDP